MYAMTESNSVRGIAMRATPEGDAQAFLINRK
jgi:hypothetical protein